MEIFKHKDGRDLFVFNLGYNHFVIDKEGVCLIDFKECDYIPVEEYELLFSENIDSILKDMNKIMHNCDACIYLKTCAQQYKFLEEKKELINYLKDLKNTKRIGEFAD